MTGQTHLMGGIAALSLPAVILAVMGIHPEWELVGIAAMGALLGSLAPDRDARESLLKRFTIPLNPSPRQRGRSHYLYVSPFALPAHLLHGALGHRTLLHSLLGLVLATLLVSVPLTVLVHPVIALGFILGYSSHLVLDGCTVSGIPLLFPQAHRVRFLPSGLCIRTGSPEEGIVFTLLAGIALFTLVSLLPNDPY